MGLLESVIGTAAKLAFGGLIPDDHDEVVTIANIDDDVETYDIDSVDDSNDYEPFEMSITSVSEQNGIVAIKGIVLSGLLGEDDNIVIDNGDDFVLLGKVVRLEDEDGQTSVISSNDYETIVYVKHIDINSIRADATVKIAIEQGISDKDFDAYLFGTGTNNEAEASYLSTYKEILEDYDGEIGPRERKQLERERERLGLSTARAQELEASANNTNHNLTDSEEEYLNEYKEMLTDYGKIGPRERRSLERSRIALGISEQRAQEIESSLANQALSVTEQEYFEIVKELLEDYGSIGGPQRKQLERARIRLNISEERAKQIESYI